MYTSDSGNTRDDIMDKSAEYCMNIFEFLDDPNSDFEKCLKFSEILLRYPDYHQKLSRFYEKMLIRWDSIPHINTIILNMIKYLPDGRERAYRIYLNMAGECKSCSCFIRLAISVLNILDDQQLARKLYKSAENTAVTMSEIILLARSILRNLQDQSWSEAIFIRASRNCINDTELKFLIKSIQYSIPGSDFILCLNNKKLSCIHDKY